jgi:hypothetical protein
MVFRSPFTAPQMKRFAAIPEGVGEGLSFLQQPTRRVQRHRDAKSHVLQQQSTRRATPTR